MAFGSSLGNVGGVPAHPDASNEKTRQWFIYEMNPGESIEDELTVKNTSSEDVKVKLYPADFVASTDGGFALEQEVESRDEVGAWVELSQTEIDLPANSQINVPFKITVPNDSSLDVGEHMGGILIQEVHEDSEESQGGIQLTVRTGVRIYITIPGEIHEDLEIKEFKVDMDETSRKGVIETSILNTGNVSETVWVRNKIEHAPLFLGIFSKKLPLENERILQVLRNDTLTSHLEFEMPWFTRARFSAEVEYKDRDNKSQFLESEPVILWILPPKPWLIKTGASVFGVVVFGGILVMIKRQSKRRKSERKRVRRTPRLITRNQLRKRNSR